MGDEHSEKADELKHENTRGSSIDSKPRVEVLVEQTIIDPTCAVSVPDYTSEDEK